MDHQPYHISLEDFYQLRQAKIPHILLDVRDPFEISLASLPEHVNIPFNALMQEFSQFRKEDKIITLCHHGIRSLNACIFLQRQGFEDVRSLQGGIDAWAKQIDFAVSVY